MFNERFNHQLSMFNLLHISTLIILILIFMIIYLNKEKLSLPKNDKLFRYTLGCLLLVFELGYHIWVAISGTYTIDMIPLTGFCAMTNVLTIYALLCHKTKLFNYIIYFALTGAVFALLFVDIAHGPPHFRYFHYFIVHYGFLLASLYYFVTNRIDIKLMYYVKASILLFSYTIMILMVNSILNENWFYLFESPVKDISDAFGSPWYTILWIISIIILVYIWYVMLYVISNRKKRIR